MTTYGQRELSSGENSLLMVKCIGKCDGKSKCKTECKEVVKLHYNFFLKTVNYIFAFIREGFFL